MMVILLLQSLSYPTVIMKYQEWLKANDYGDVGCISLNQEEVEEFHTWMINQERLVLNCHDAEKQIRPYMAMKYLNYYLALPNIDINQEIDNIGITPLMLASANGFVDLIKKIVAFPDVDLNKQSSH